MTASNKILINTGILYGRMLLTICISLYSTRLVLHELGSIEYGIFNLVAGIIAILSFLNTALAGATQRFLSFYHNSEDLFKRRQIFKNSVLLHFIIAIVIVLSLQIAGLFLFDGFLNIPKDKIIIAKNVFHLMSGTVFFTIVAVPFSALLNAYENMLAIAIINIIETLFKLAIALLLSIVVDNKLNLFAMLTGGLSILVTAAYIIYCSLKYVECSNKGSFTLDKSITSELVFFAGWNLFGTVCLLARTQGLAILLNIFFGTVVNSAYGIATQVAAQVSFFALTLLQAINPQIVKSEGNKDRIRMLRLSMIASKFGFYLLALLAIPCIIEMSGLLTFWLKNVPQHSTTFCILILVGSLINQTTVGMQSALQAIGKIRLYQIVVGSLLLMNLPLAYLFLKYGYPAYSVLIGYVLIEVLACIARLYFTHKYAGLIISEYVNKVLFKIILPGELKSGVECNTEVISKREARDKIK